MGLHKIINLIGLLTWRIDKITLLIAHVNLARPLAVNFKKTNTLIFEAK
jgi:hypothetical protein